jgi:citrate synthase
MNGLDDVIAADTVLSDADGQAGTLIIRGHSLDELAEGSTYEAVLALLWDGLFDTAPSALAVPALLGRARSQAFECLRGADVRRMQQDPVEALRVLLAQIDDGESLDTALRLVGAAAVFTAAVLRLRQGLKPLEPDATVSHSADLLRMIHGTPPTAEQVVALDRYLVTVSDHGLNASTFAARVVASTRAGLTSAVIAALSALKGPLHGGAPGPVLDYLDSIGKPEMASTWLQKKLSRGERLMGFGHRIYRVRDPRADSVKGALQTLIRAGQVDEQRLQLAEAIEAAALKLLAAKKPERPLQTNVEFYTALLLEALGLPRDAFTCVFAISRTCGWIAHAREQILCGRLIRPRSRYVGPHLQSAPTQPVAASFDAVGTQSLRRVL